MTQTIAVERVDHIGVRVHDLDRALAFYRVLGFDLVRRPENDDVGIIRNEHGVELNLVFNANAGDLTTNILMEVPDKFPGYSILRFASSRSSIPGDDRWSESERYCNHPGAGHFRPGRTGVGLHPRPRP